MTDVSFSTDRVKNHIQKGKTLVYKKTNVENNINLKVQIICRNNFGHSLRDTHPELKGFQFCLGYGTPVEQSEGIRGLKREVIVSNILLTERVLQYYLL